jgi:hypothetical protein
LGENHPLMKQLMAFNQGFQEGGHLALKEKQLCTQDMPPHYIPTSFLYSVHLKVVPYFIVQANSTSFIAVPNLTSLLDSVKDRQWQPPGLPSNIMAQASPQCAPAPAPTLAPSPAPAPAGE